MPSTLGAALFYATEKEWPVVPVWPVEFDNEGTARCRCGNQECRSVGKHPIAKLHSKPVAPRGVVDATCSPAKIQEWWKLVPDANIGVRGDKFFALDVDDEDGLFELVSRYGSLPDTVESHSGSGGRHILFKQPKGQILGNEEGDLPNGINVRGNRGYIIVSPSNHKCGPDCRYEWELSSHPRDVELAEAPDWLIKLIGQPKERVEIKEIEAANNAPNISNLDMSGHIKDLITSGPVEGEDRSSNDQKVIVALLRAGCSESQVKAVFDHYPIGTQGKYSERGDEYLHRSIARGVMYVGPATKKNAESIIIPGRPVSEQERNMEKRALDIAYLQGWHDALSGKTSLVSKLWPDHIGIEDTSVALYGLGMRTDFKVDDTEREFAALVVPYRNSGEVINVGYDISNTPTGVSSRAWESSAKSHVFDADIDGSKLTGQVLVTEDWDTAVHTYLNHGKTFSWLDILGMPYPGSNPDERLACLQALARLLADSERVLLAWPENRRKDAEKLATIMDRGAERVVWMTMPAPMKDMYQKFGMRALHINRYVQQATPVI